MTRNDTYFLSQRFCRSEVPAWLSVYKAEVKLLAGTATLSETQGPLNLIQVLGECITLWLYD